MNEIIDRFAGLHVAVLGDFLLDEYVYCRAGRVSREAPVPVLEVEHTELRPGGAGNVAVNAATLGAMVHCFGVTAGLDNEGKQRR